MSGIAPNPLNDISKVYLEAVAAKPDFLDLDKDGNKKEPMKKAAKEVEAPKERLKTDRNMFNISKDEQKAAKERLLAKARAKRAKMSEGLDPVGQEDADIDNDGDTDKSDKYLHKRRKAISKAMKKRMDEGVRDKDPEKGTEERKARLEKKRGMKLDDHPEYKKEETEISEIHVQAHTPHEVPSGNLKGLVKKAVKRIDADNDGDVDKDDPKEKGMGEFVPSADGKKKVRTKMAESRSNWRQDLSEVMVDDVDSKQIKEKNVKNKIKINPKLGEAIEALGGTLIEMVELDEETPVERLDRISKENVAKRAAAAKKEKEKRDKSTADFQAHKKEVLAKGGRPVDALDSWQKKQMKKEEIEQIGEGTVADRAKNAVSDDRLSAEQEKTNSSMDRLRAQTKRHNKSTALARTQARIAAKKSEDTARAMHPKPGVSGRRIEDPKPTGSKPSGYRIEEIEQIDEKITAKTDMGMAIKDFYASKSPQLAGRTKEERRKAAIAAVLTARRGGKKLGEQMDTEPAEPAIDKKKEMMDKQKLANMKMLQQKQQMLQRQKLQMQKSGKLPLEAD